uniref:G-protein coupled receptors family 1 profile domain-containing protein n=1 Tax=Bos indicus x Bos taurus TaxID=30522 RepID=A0A4W2H8W1_BOBOX
MELLTSPNNMTKFLLLGLTQNPQLQKILFVVLLPMSLFIVLATLLIVITISLNDFFTCVSTPKLITDLLHQRRTMSWGGCLSQLFLEYFLGGVEVIVLIVMAYDHYVAICKPLHYTTIRQQGLCQLLVVVAWIGDILHATVQILFMVDCGSNAIGHFMCDFFSLLKLACSHTYTFGLVVAANTGGMTLLIFLLLTSYTIILSSLKSHGSERLHKALSTCGSHFTVVVLFFVPCIFTHIRPVVTYPVEKFVVMFFAILTPVLNPITYTMRNTEVKNAMRSLLKRRVTQAIHGAKKVIVYIYSDGYTCCKV